MNHICFLQKYGISKICHIIIVVLLFSICTNAIAQVSGDFRSLTSASWDNAATWERYNGTTWEAAGVGANNPGLTPNAASNVYIQSGHNITLNRQEACNDLHIANSTTSSLGTSGIITLSGFTLELNGKMRTYWAPIGSIPGTSSTLGFSTYPFTATTGKLTMVGLSRTILLAGEWSSSITNASIGSFPLEINLNAGEVVSLAASVKLSSLVLQNGTLDAGTNRIALDNGTTGQGNATINPNGIFKSAASGNGTNSVFSRTGSTISGSFTLNGKMILLGTSPQMQFSSIVFNVGSTVELNKAGAQNFLSSDAVTHPGAAVIPSYYNLILSNSGSKTPAANFTVTNDLNITGTAALDLSVSTIIASIGGNWTNWGTAGFKEGTAALSTVEFIGAGTQTIKTALGEDFLILKKSGIGTLTLQDDIRFAGTGSELNISAGTIDAGTQTVSGTSSTKLTMSGGIFKIGKLATTVPEFPISTGYSLTGGTIELNGNGPQILRGSRAYRNISFSNTGTKNISSSITSLTGVLTISNTAVLDITGFSMGGAGTSLTMTGNSRYINDGTGTKPDAQGTYTLAPTSTIEFSNTALTQQDIRLAPNYANIDISGDNVGLSGASSVLNMQAGTTFSVTNVGVFHVKNTKGFTGTTLTAINITNNPTVVLMVGSTIVYDGASQLITNTQPYQNLGFSGTGIKTAPATDIVVLGDLFTSGSPIFDGYTNANRIVFASNNPQSYYTSASTMLELFNITNNNSSVEGLSIDASLGILNELNLNSAARLILNTGDIHLRSTATRTAHVTDLGTSAASSNIIYNNGRFYVERYLTAIKAWRLLATPVITFANGDGTSPTINESWREGGAAPVSFGYGTRITGPGAVGYPNGVDEYTPRGSMKSYSMATNNYVDITSADLVADNMIANEEGYFVFVRGDRGVNVTGAASATNLRMKGKLRTGDQQFFVNAGSFQSVGNPFASQINFKTISNSSVTEAFTIWDPSSTGINNAGAFETYVKESNPPYDFRLNSVGPVLNTIESGQAFFIQSASNGSITIEEADKSTGSNTVSKQNVQDRVVASIPTLEINLHSKDVNANDYLADAAVLNFDNGFSDGIDKLDVRKINNSYDNISILKNAKLLLVERRPPLQATDTIFLNIGSTRIAHYHFEINPSLLANSDLDAFLIDAYLHETSAVSLSTITNIHFDITADAASRAANRFKIVFKATKPAPAFILVDAYTNAAKQNTVHWKISNEKNVMFYSIERSDDGIIFNEIQHRPALQNDYATVDYQCTDAQPLLTDQYYRIKMSLGNSNIVYSQIVKVDALKNDISILVSPNPVQNKTLQLQLNNQPLGSYNVQLVNNIGQIVQHSTFAVNAYLQNISISLDKNLASGNYTLIMVSANGDKIIRQISVL